MLEFKINIKAFKILFNKYLVFLEPKRILIAGKTKDTCSKDIFWQFLFIKKNELNVI